MSILNSTTSFSYFYINSLLFVVILFFTTIFTEASITIFFTIKNVRTIPVVTQIVFQVLHILTIYTPFVLHVRNSGTC